MWRRSSVAISRCSDARLSRVDLTNADMDHATLTGAGLGGARWSNTTCPDGTLSNNDGNSCVNNLG